MVYGRFIFLHDYITRTTGFTCLKVLTDQVKKHNFWKIFQRVVQLEYFLPVGGKFWPENLGPLFWILYISLGKGLCSIYQQWLVCGKSCFSRTHKRFGLREVSLESITFHTLWDRDSFLFLLGETRKEPLLATARFFDLPPSTARDE